MSVAQMKLEAINKITTLASEKILQNVLKLLESADEKEPVNLSQNYDAIKEHYGVVLQKLAQ
ncbi:hypothetical protein [Segetibacter aerophilus]|uniref:Uncharacterized protein n=1 Tax=Segetibacter aerophilus TaxID=670293 RepID=A0A512B8A0_9BACT|nr:hypothetical protein [Segetibacter aerophilus]GEO08186.1 hypothetical protein SAE01_06820 [Segetibacter aerophilus]